jgi:PPM family protein phosphatase
VLPLVHAGLTDPGRQRLENQDRFLADSNQGLFLVSDGMADNISPQQVVELLPGMFRESLGDTDSLDSPHVLRLVADILGRLSDRVFQESLKHCEMLGATLALVVIRQKTALVAHLGDSRVYLCRDETLQALTRDHSRVWDMIAAGELQEETPQLRRWNGGPTRYVGMADTPAADVRCLTVQPGDRILLCSDGLTGELDDESIRRILAKPWTPEQMCREFVERANAAGGHDNITVLVVQVEASAAPSE